MDEIDVITIDRTTPFNPSGFINSDWSLLSQDERSLELLEVNISKVKLVPTILIGNETSTYYKKRMERLREQGGITLDAKVLLVLWKNQHLVPESWKQATEEGRYVEIFFDGTVLTGPKHYEYILCFAFRFGEWSWNWKPTFGLWGHTHSSAVLVV